MEGDKLKEKNNLEGKETKERRELNPQTVEQLILLAQKVNEGNNGIVFRIDTSDIPEELKTELQENAPELMANEGAVKLLKIYRAGAVEHEHQMQQRVYEAVQKSEKKDIAKVPTPLGKYDLEISEELQGFFAANGIESLDKRFQAIFMEYVPGKDLATILFTEILKHDPDCRINLNTARFDQLQAEVIRFLKFVRPGGKGQNEEQRAYEQNKILQENGKKVFDFLKKKDFVINPAILQQVEGAIKEIRKNGITLLDCHERNVIINGPINGKEAPQAYLIDFGEARLTADIANAGAEGVRGYIQDTYIIEILKKLSISETDAIQNEYQNFVKELKITAQKIEKKNPAAWKKDHSEIFSGDEISVQKKLTTSLEKAINKTTPLEISFLPFLQNALDTNSVSKDLAKKIIDQVIEKNKQLPVVMRNQLVKFRRGL